MKTIKTHLTMIAAACTLAAPAAFAIINPSFETGNFNGWTLNYTAGAATNIAIKTSYDAKQVIPQPPVHYVPSTTVDPFGEFSTSTPSGSYFARITAAAQNQYIYITQSFTMDLGYGLTGLAAFDSVGTSALNDVAELTISSAVDGTQTIWNRSVSNTGPNGATPWEVWTYYAPAYDTYTLTFRIKNVGSSTQNSIALLDAVEIVQVPDNGSTLAMLGAAVLGIFGLKRKLVKA